LNAKQNSCNGWWDLIFKFSFWMLKYKFGCEI
jgi:hypothetical protein